ncbi:MAG: ABC transporter ATP-binding protein [Gammaproteobacteria bacterium]|nr:ABC transporter ATP-binding protein [Gammaproteobacteria bacterium]
MKSLSIENLTKVYANGLEALKGISLDVQEGDFFALLGPNGAGKSTTIGIISSLINKTSGKIRVCKYDIDTDFDLAKACIGIVPQEINFNQFETCLDVVVNQGGYYGIRRTVALERAEKYLGQLGLWDRRDEVSRNLSGGLKRRLMIARALIHEPRILILDEPTAGVDVELRRSMWDFLTGLNVKGTTIVLTTHYLEEAERLCRNIAIIDHGKIIENTTMRSLLTRLSKETYIVETRDSIPDNLVLSGHEVRIIDEHCLEIEVDKSQTLNSVYEQLSARDIHVLTMRTRSNRLEELFLSLVDRKLKPEN